MSAHTRAFDFQPFCIPAAAASLRAEVRAFLSHALPAATPAERARSWLAFDAEFSRALGARGWIGVTWPKRYGGHERSAFERYVLIEELLAAGAPVGAHWIADRQSGPLLLRYGTEQQRSMHLPAIARGEMYFCIGMSEPGAGSDLASLKTAAVKTGDGWRIRGQKLWTTHANKAQRMIALVRTSTSEDRHGGLSQLLLDLSLPGITVRPIADLVGDEHFNEVFFDDVHVGDDALIGSEGQGWQQVTAELSLERSGPERYLSSFQLFYRLVEAAGAQPSESIVALIGRITAELWTLRQMSLSVAGRLSQGQDPVLEAAVVKDLGNTFEQELPRLVQALVDSDVDMVGSGALSEVLGYLLQVSPSFSLRGGTREILRGIVARGLGLR
jgi:alkylation response protein AidB-like acyl-CoA dehydrogenase